MRALLALLTTALLAVTFAACGGDDTTKSSAPDGSESGGITASAETNATTPAADLPENQTDDTTAPDAGGCEAVKAPDTADRTVKKPGKADQLPKGAKATVTMKTSCGTIVIALDTKNQPKTASTFAYLVKKGFYDGLPFHRIAGTPDNQFVIQGGSPGGAPDGGPGWSVQEDPPADAKYTRGVVSMAKTGAEPAGTSGSQFYIVTGADVGLPPDYAIAGKVTEGDDTVTKISEVEKDGSDVPLEPVLIEKATLKVQ